MNESPIILFTIVVCFIIMITISIFNFMRIGNLKNASAELEISLKNEYESNAEKNVAEVLSNISLVKAEMSNNINTLKKKQLIVDTAQDTNNKTGVDKMTSNISLIQSNIDNVIEPKLVDFDGNFKSLEGAIESNKSDIAAVGSSITQLNTDVGTGITHLSTQFNTQHDLLSDEIQKINDSQYNDSQFFSDKIRKLQASQTKIESDLVVGMNVNKQSIANNKVGLETANENIAELDKNLTTLGGQTLELANIVDDHDVILRAL